MASAPVPGPRKRIRSQQDELGRERAKRVKPGHDPRNAVVKHALLAQYYSEVQTLRQYVLAKLPASSRIRRRKIAAVGLADPPLAKPDETALGSLLDSTLVGRRQHAHTDHDHRWQQWRGFSQKGDESSVTLSDGVKGSIFSQSEVRQSIPERLFEALNLQIAPVRKDC